MFVPKNHSLWLTAAVAVFVTVAGTVDALQASLPSFQTPYVTRAEAVMLLLQARIPKIPALSSNGEFPDVPRGSWYERYIVIAERLGILQVNPVTRRVRPDDPVTRVEFLSLAAKTFGIDASLFSPGYSDVSQEAWYAPVAGMAERLRLFPADPDQSHLRPEEFMIHTEVARAVQALIAAAGRQKTAQNIAYMQQTKPVQQSTPTLFSYTRTTLVPSTDPRQLQRLRSQVLTLVNAARSEAGLGTVQRNSLLETSAQEYATNMAKENFFGHVGPTGETLQERMERSGYYRPYFQLRCFCISRFILGENLAKGQKTAEEVVNDWLKSPTHRETIMNPDFTDTGIGISAGVWVEHFGGKQK